MVKTVLKIVAWMAITIVIAIAIFMLSYAWYMNSRNTGNECQSQTKDWLGSRIESFNKKFPTFLNSDSFEISESAEFLYNDKGGTWLVPFESNEKKYEATILCNGETDIKPIAR